VQKLDASLANVALAKLAAEKTGQRPAVLAVGLFLSCCLMILYTHGWDTLVKLVGFSYPVYASFKALKTEAASDDTEWLTYWVVFGTFILLEDFSSLFFEESNWSFLYYIAKLVFILWLFMPKFKGANTVFKKIISPVLTKWEKSIDQARVEAREFADKARVEGQQAATTAAFAAAAASVTPPTGKKDS